VIREGVKVGRNEKGRCESEGGLVGGVRLREEWVG